MHKYMFIDRYKQSYGVEDCNKFFRVIEDLKLYMVEFEKDETMKANVYLSNYVVCGKNY